MLEGACKVMPFIHRLATRRSATLGALLVVL
jgi:hypothetical protein